MSSEKNTFVLVGVRARSPWIYVFDVLGVGDSLPFIIACLKSMIFVLCHLQKLSVLIRVYPRLSAVVSLLDVAPGRKTENEPRINADKHGSMLVVLGVDDERR